MKKNCKLPKDQSYPLGNKLNNSLWYARHGVYFLVREHYMVMYHILIFFFYKIKNKKGKAEIICENYIPM